MKTRRPHTSTLEAALAETVSAGGSTVPRTRLNRRGPAPLALEQRFMFDGAAVAAAVHVEASAHANHDPLLQIEGSAKAVQPVLVQAEKQAEQAVTQFFQQPDAAKQLFALFNGGFSAPTAQWQQAADNLVKAINEGSYAIKVELRSNIEMQGAMGAFAAKGESGSPVIYLNADWLKMAPSSATVARVLAEEIGHSMDAAINGSRDTQGDEGDAFATLLSGGDPSGSARLALDDHAILRIDGKDIEVEEASVTFKAIYQGTPTAWSLQANAVTLTSKLDATAGSVKFISADPSAPYFSGNNVAGTLVYSDSSGKVYSINGVISRQFKTGGTTNAFYFYATGSDGLVNGVSDSTYLVSLQSDNTNYTYDGSANAQYRTSSDPVDRALNAVMDSSVPTLRAATSSSNGAQTAQEAGGINNQTSGRNGTGNVLDSTLISGFSSGLSVISAGNSDPTTQQAVVSNSTSASNYTSINGIYGTLRIGANGTYDYVVSNNNTGVQGLRQSTDALTDTFTYTVKDSSGNLATTTLTVTITGQNDAPVANNDYNTSQIGGTAVTGNVISNDTDVDKYGEKLSLVGLTATADLNTYSAGSTTISYVTSNGISSVNGYFAYILDNGTYRPLSTNATSATQGTAITVTSISPLTLSADPLNYTITSGTRLGFDNKWGATASGNLKYADVTTTSSSASITLKNIAGNIVAGMTVTGTNIPDGTTVVSISGTNIVLSKSPTGTPGSMTFTATAGMTLTGTYGTLVFDANGSGAYTYTPNSTGTGGTDTFTYKTTDLGGQISTATLSIQVLGTPTGLTVVSDTNQINAGTTTPVTGNVVTNDTPTTGTITVINGATAQAQLGTSQAIGSGSYQDYSGQYGTLRLYSTGSYSYTLNTDSTTANTLNALQSGSTLTDSFQYLAQNTGGSKAAAALTITINGVNDAPVLKLNTSGSGSTDFVSSYTQGTSSGTSLATLTGAHIADVDNTYFSKITVSFDKSNFPDSSDEQLLISGATDANTISSLGGLTGTSTGSFTLGGVSYTYATTISGNVATLTFNTTNAITQAQAETLLTALSYKNTSTNPTAGSNRVFSIKVYDNGSNENTTLASSGTQASNSATSTITVYNTSTAPIATTDTVSATEAGGIGNAIPGIDPTGNVLTGETSNNSGTEIGDSGESITVTKAGKGAAFDGAVSASSTSASNATSITGNYGTLAIGADGSYSYAVDNANSAVQALQQGSTTLSDTFTYQITDQTGRTATATLTVVIHGANDAPVKSTQGDVTVAANQAMTSLVVPAFTDVDNASLAYTATLGDGSALPNWLSFNAASRTFTGTPPGGSNGTYAIKVTGTDAGNLSDSLTFNLVVQDTVAVTAAADTASATEAGGVNNGTAGTAPTGNVITNDSGTGITVTKAGKGAALDGTVSANSTSASNAASITGNYGTLSIGADGSYKYTIDNSNAIVQALNAGGTLTDIFSYQITDQASQTATATLTVTINGVNDAPVGVADSYSVAEDATLTVSAAAGVLANDTDADGNALSASLVSGPAHGSLTLNADGSFTYTPAANYNGSDSFTYKANDGSADSGTTTVTLTVTPVNDAPTAGNASVSTPFNTAKTDSLPAATDIDGDSVTYAKGSDPAHGTVSVGADGSYTYTPANGYTGSDSFTYTIDDGHGGNHTYTISVTVGAATNNAPVGAADSYSVAEDATLTVSAAAGVLANDTDADGNALSASLVSGPAHGSLTLNADGSFTYTPAANYNGSDSFTYKANDGSADSGTTTVTLTVTPVNDAPTAGNASVSTPFNTAKTDSLPAATDIDGDSVTYAKGSDPAHGTVTVGADGSYTYTPANGYSGSDSFTYTIDDGHGGNHTYTISVTVGNNAAPSSTDDSVTTDEDTAVILGASDFGTYADTEGSPLSAVKITTLPAAGTFEYNGAGGWTAVTLNQVVTAADIAGGKLRFTPAANANGSDYATIGFKVSDGTAYSTSAYTLTVNVTPINDAPTAGDDSVSTPFNTAKTGSLPNAADVDGDTVSYAKGSDPAHGTVSVAADGSYTYTPADGYTGSDSFTYTISDGHGGSHTYTVSITVGAAPVVEVPPPVTPPPPVVEVPPPVTPPPPVVEVPPPVTPPPPVVEVPPPVTPPPPVVEVPPPVIPSKPAVEVQQTPVVVVDTKPSNTPTTSAPSDITTVEKPTVDTKPADSSVVATALQSSLIAKLVADDVTNAGQGKTGVVETLTSQAVGAVRIAVFEASEPTLMLFHGVPDQNFDQGAQVRFQMPADAFVHTQQNAVVRVSAEKTEGGPLPSWLHFDASTGKFEGKPPANAPKEISIRITAKDTEGREAFTIFRIKLVKEKDKQQTPAGRVSLSDQIRSAAQRTAHQGRLAKLERVARAQDRNLAT